jgi:hypothetical protein
VTGPYTSVSCTLTLLKNEIRLDSSAPDKPEDYGRSENGDDPRFRDNVGAIQSIATSSGQNDSGLFELNFRDERYLPFEGAGVISQWRLELSGKWRIDGGDTLDLAQFDFDTITDVIFHLRYTARNGGSTLKQAAVDALQEAINTMTLGDDRSGLTRLFSAKHEFPGEWHRFLQGATDRSLTLELPTSKFPFLSRGKTISIEKVGLLMQPTKDLSSGAGIKFVLTYGGKTATYSETPEAAFEKIESLLYQEKPFGSTLDDTTADTSWTLEMTQIPKALKIEGTERLAIEDLILVCYYTVQTGS